MSKIKSIASTFIILKHKINSERSDIMNRKNHRIHMQTTDFGPEPFVTNIEQRTLQNRNYRTALWTGNYLQLTLMSIPPGGEIGLEIHPDTDQFLRIEGGNGVAMMGPSKDRLSYQRRIKSGCAVFVPAKTWHNVVNTGNQALKIYSIYAPPHHPHGTVQATKCIADAEES